MYFFHETERYIFWTVEKDAPKFSIELVNTAYEWQTIIAALIAGIPAAIGAYLVWRQVKIQREELQRIKAKEEASARIKLSLALAQLSKHWRTCVGAVLDDQPRPALLPTDALNTLMDAAPIFDKNTFEAIRCIISDAQVFDSRYGSASIPMTGGIQEILLTDLAMLNLSTDEIFPYARYEVEVVIRGDRKRANIERALRSLIRRSGRNILSASEEIAVSRALNRMFPRQTSYEVPTII